MDDIRSLNQQKKNFKKKKDIQKIADECFNSKQNRKQTGVRRWHLMAGVRGHSAPQGDWSSCKSRRMVWLTPSSFSTTPLLSLSLSFSFPRWIYLCTYMNLCGLSISVCVMNTNAADDTWVINSSPGIFTRGAWIKRMSAMRVLSKKYTWSQIISQDRFFFSFLNSMIY